MGVSVKEVFFLYIDNVCTVICFIYLCHFSSYYLLMFSVISIVCVVVLLVCFFSYYLFYLFVETFYVSNFQSSFSACYFTILYIYLSELLEMPIIGSGLWYHKQSSVGELEPLSNFVDLSNI